MQGGLRHGCQPAASEREGAPSLRRAWSSRPAIAARRRVSTSACVLGGRRLDACVDLGAQIAHNIVVLAGELAHLVRVRVVIRVRVRVGGGVRVRVRVRARVRVRVRARVRARVRVRVSGPTCGTPPHAVQGKAQSCE